MTASFVLARAQRLSDTAVAQRLGLSRSKAGRRCSPFLQFGIEGPHSEARPGRPRSYVYEKVAALTQRAIPSRPAFFLSERGIQVVPKTMQLTLVQLPRQVALRGPSDPRERACTLECSEEGRIRIGEMRDSGRILQFSQGVSHRSQS